MGTQIRTNGEIERDNKIVSALKRIADGIEESNKDKKSVIECLENIVTRLDSLDISLSEIKSNLDNNYQIPNLIRDLTDVIDNFAHNNLKD